MLLRSRREKGPCKSGHSDPTTIVRTIDLASTSHPLPPVPQPPNLPSIHYLLRNTIPSPIRRDQNFNMFIFMIYQFFKAFLYDII